MDTVALPETRLYADDDTVIAEWRDGDDEYQAKFARVDMEDESCDDDEVAVFAGLAEIGGARVTDERATVEDVPGDVRWAIKQFVARPVHNTNNRDTSDHDARGVA